MIRVDASGAMAKARGFCVCLCMGGRDEPHRQIETHYYTLCTYQVSIRQRDGGVEAKRRGGGSVVGEGSVVAAVDEEINAGGGKGDEGKDPKDLDVGCWMLVVVVVVSGGVALSPVCSVYGVCVCRGGVSPSRVVNSNSMGCARKMSGRIYRCVRVCVCVWCFSHDGEPFAMHL